MRDRGDGHALLHHQADGFLLELDAAASTLSGHFALSGVRVSWTDRKNEPLLPSSGHAKRSLGNVNPYEVHDIARTEAWVSVGTDHDTAAFALASVKRW